MCLVNLLSKEELEKEKAKLPEEFDVWKVGRGKGFGRWEPEYRNDDEPTLNQAKVYKARMFSARRTSLDGDYLPAFHAFFSREEAERYKFLMLHWLDPMVKRFIVKREWLKAIGETGLEVTNRVLKCGAFSHIQGVQEEGKERRMKNASSKNEEKM